MNLIPCINKSYVCMYVCIMINECGKKQSVIRDLEPEKRLSQFRVADQSVGYDPPISYKGYF